MIVLMVYRVKVNSINMALELEVMVLLRLSSRRLGWQVNRGLMGSDMFSMRWKSG
jgi:hypothetical protein